MKLASLKSGRDGRLVVVSRDLSRCADASAVAPTLQAALDDWDAVRTDVTNLAARNGTNQKRLETVADDLQSRQNTLAGMLGDITDADMAQAAADLQTAQLSVQSAAYVFQALKESSLLNVLR